MHSSRSSAHRALLALASALAAVVSAIAQPIPGPAPQPICTVVEEKELMITDLSVVEDCVRTTWFPSCDPVDPGSVGVWTFGHLIAGVAGTDDPAVLSDFVLKWLGQWEDDVVVNSFTIPERRTGIRALVIDPWLEASGGQQLDMKIAPFRLLAIVNRVDLRRQPVYGASTAGEARFVFGVIDLNFPEGAPPFTVIFEYGIDAATCEEIKAWASRWHALGTLPFGARFNAKLENITTSFTKIGASPHKPNGSAINQIRTNEIALAGPWEIREFTLQPDPFSDTPVAPLLSATVKQTPNHTVINAEDKLGSQTVADFINEFEAEILLEQHVVPEIYQDRPFLGGSTINNIDFWNDFTSPPINNNEARHKFSLNTCNGCHGAETGTFFLQVAPRSPGQEASLSGFLTGIDVADPITNQIRHFDDLKRRAIDLCDLLTTPCSRQAEDVPTNRTH